MTRPSLVALAPGEAEEVPQDGLAHAPPPRCLGRVHRFQLSVLCVESLDSPNAEDHAGLPGTEERDVRAGQTFGIKGVSMAKRCQRAAKSQVGVEERPHVGPVRVVDPDHEAKRAVRRCHHRKYGGRSGTEPGQ